MKNSAAMLAMLAILSGYSIDNALTQHTVDMSVVKVRANQLEIEDQIGTAAETKIEGNTKTCIYYIESGDPGAGRGAADHAAFGLWEIWGRKSDIRKFKLALTYVDDSCTGIKLLPLEKAAPNKVILSQTVEVLP